MSKPNTEFNLGLRDIDLIEDALNLVIARRSSTMSAIAGNNVENTTQVPEIKNLSRAIITQLGVLFIPKLYWRNRRALWQVIKNSRKMTKKWPFEMPVASLDRTLADLRAEYGIKLLTPEQRTPSQTTHFDYSIVSS